MLKDRTGVVRQRGPRAIAAPALEDPLAAAGGASVTSGFFLQPDRTNDKKSMPNAQPNCLSGRFWASWLGTRNGVTGPALLSKRKSNPTFAQLRARNTKLRNRRDPLQPPRNQAPWIRPNYASPSRSAQSRQQ